MIVMDMEFFKEIKYKYRDGIEDNFSRMKIKCGHFSSNV